MNLASRRIQRNSADGVVVVSDLLSVAGTAVAPFYPLAFSLSPDQSERWLVGAVGIEPTAYCFRTGDSGLPTSVVTRAAEGSILKNRIDVPYCRLLPPRTLCKLACSREIWRKRVGVEPTIRPAKGRIAGFEGREGHRTPFASTADYRGEVRFVSILPDGAADERFDQLEDGGTRTDFVVGMRSRAANFSVGQELPDKSFADHDRLERVTDGSLAEV